MLVVAVAAFNSALLATLTVAVEVASLDVFAVAGAAGTSAGSGVVSRASKNWLSRSALDVERMVDAAEATRRPSVASEATGSAFSSIGV